MSNGRYAKPGAGTPGFTRLLWRAVASFNYLFGPAGASAYLPVAVVALDGARRVAALLWGGAR